MMDSRPTPQALSQPQPAKPGLPVLQSSALLGSGSRVVIEHRGERYQLCLTRAGKLILVK